MNIGDKFGRWEVIGGNKEIANRQRAWLCQCDCGTQKYVNGSHLRAGRSQSCGCLAIEKRNAVNRKHGLSTSPAYRSWQAMLGRCLDERNSSFKSYGGVGVSVCDRWMTFENFLNDMGERPEGKTLDRRDGSKNYTPDNCRWSTRREQQANRKNTVFVTALGETLPIVEWERRSGISAQTIRNRISSGVSPDKAVTTPVKKLMHAVLGIEIEEVK